MQVRVPGISGFFAKIRIEIGEQQSEQAWEGMN